jgi:carbonic anhydrase/acetyltransferase-like protein (isoleucine patch superfamily)
LDFPSERIPDHGELLVSIDSNAFIHPLAVVIGNVSIGARTSVWPLAVIRADTDAITVGDDCNIQDGSVLHVDQGYPIVIGSRVSIGHRAVLHGATVEDDCLIAMGAILLNGVVVGEGSLVGAGAVCREGMRIPPRSVVLGLPARVAREATSEITERIRRTMENYLELQADYRSGKYGRQGT